MIRAAKPVNKKAAIYSPEFFIHLFQMGCKKPVQLRNKYRSGANEHFSFFIAAFIILEYWNFLC